MQVKMKIRDYGEIVIDLYPEVAPITVNNFVKLVKENFYQGKIFHRVIYNFMIQGGGYDQQYQISEVPTIVGEFSANGIENNIKHERGVISMARTSVKDSASSQFFIMHKDSPHLDGQYAAFGKVVKGIEVVDKIATTKTAASDVPVTPIVIESAEIMS